MSLRTRRPEPPTIAALPEYTNVHEVVTRLNAERDGALDRLDNANRECVDLIDETERLVDERDALLQERYDLTEQALPYLTSPTWPPTDAPVDAVCFDELAEKLGFMPGLRTDGDDTDFAGQIAAFGREYAGWE